jgi:hypothetical protein
LNYLSAPIDVLLKRLQRRAMENPPIRRDQLVQWANVFQAPADEEKALFDRFVMLETPALDR